MFIKIKSFLFALLFGGFGLTTYAQLTQADADAETDAVLTLLGIQKKEAVAHLVSIEPKDSVAFWKMYNEYLSVSKKNAKSRIQLYEKTAQSYNNLSNETADSLAKNFFKQRVEQEKNIETYYNKIKDVTNPVLAFQFYQAEVYLLTALRAQIYQQIPTYGELLNSTKK